MKRDFSFTQELRVKQQPLPNGGWVLLPDGSIDSATCDEFSNRIQRFLADGGTARPDLLIDLSGVRYISSVGLGALIQLMKKSLAASAAFALYDPQLSVRRVLEISKLDFLLLKDADSAPEPFAAYVKMRESARAAAQAAAKTAPEAPRKKR